MDVSRNFDFLTRYKESFPDKTDALAGKVNKQWVKYSSQDYINNSNYISYGLKDMGLKKGDKIALISNNRPEWNFMDMGMSQLGIISVPIFATLTTASYKQILEHSEARLIFVSDNALLKKIEPLVSEISTLEKIYSFDEIEGVSNWKEVLEIGKQNSEKHADEVEEIKKGISAEDWMTLIYTSGTTGDAKGVMLSHRNLVSNAKMAANHVFKLGPEHRYLSILPICHVGERMANYQSQYSGCSLYYGQNMGTIPDDLKDVAPHGFAAVPRILEKVFDKIMSAGEKLTGMKRKMFFWAVDLGLNYELNGKNGGWYEFKLKIANKLIFSKWREAIGGNIIFIGVGGAALQPRLEKVFWAAGAKILNMYGLTETSPVITINREESSLIRLGSVGAIIDNVEVKIAEDGEILCRGENIMLGYYKDDKTTSEAIDSEGWFSTGDIGRMEDEFLFITDRKKEIFKLSNGKYVSPQSVENKFMESVYIDQIMVIGEGEKHASALISPNYETLKKWCKDNNIAYTNKEELVGNSEVVAHYNSIVKEFNKDIEKDEQLKRVRIVSDVWAPETGNLSPTLKLKRKVLAERYKDTIKEIFR